MIPPFVFLLIQPYNCFFPLLFSLILLIVSFFNTQYLFPYLHLPHFCWHSPFSIMLFAPAGLIPSLPSSVFNSKHCCLCSYMLFLVSLSIHLTTHTALSSLRTASSSLSHPFSFINMRVAKGDGEKTGEQWRMMEEKTVVMCCGWDGWKQTEALQILCQHNQPWLYINAVRKYSSWQIQLRNALLTNIHITNNSCSNIPPKQLQLHPSPSYRTSLLSPVSRLCLCRHLYLLTTQHLHSDTVFTKDN